MKNDLTARYIYAVTRHLPQKNRSDIEQELESLISDMLEERCREHTPDEQDLRAVLTELGTPEELALKYCGDENKALIGGTYFLLYQQLLKIVLPIVAAFIPVASLFSAFLTERIPLNDYGAIGRIIGQTIGSTIAGVIQAFAVITIIFAVLERKKTVLQESDFLSQLPYVPQSNDRIKPHEPMIRLAWTVFMVILFLGFPHVIGAWLKDIGWIPLFSTELLKSYRPAIILWSLFGVIKEIYGLAEGRYSKRLAAVTVLCNLFIAIFSSFVFLNSRIINPVFTDYLESLFPLNGDQAIITFLSNLNILFLVVIFAVLMIEIITVLVKAMNRNEQNIDVKIA